MTLTASARTAGAMLSDAFRDHAANERRAPARRFFTASLLLDAPGVVTTPGRGLHQERSECAAFDGDGIARAERGAELVDGPDLTVIERYREIAQTVLADVDHHGRDGRHTDRRRRFAMRSEAEALVIRRRRAKRWRRRCGRRCRRSPSSGWRSRLSTRRLRRGRGRKGVVAG